MSVSGKPACVAGAMESPFSPVLPHGPDEDWVWRERRISNAEDQQIENGVYSRQHHAEHMEREQKTSCVVDRLGEGGRARAALEGTVTAF